MSSDEEEAAEDSGSELDIVQMLIETAKKKERELTAEFFGAKEAWSKKKEEEKALSEIPLPSGTIIAPDLAEPDFQFDVSFCSKASFRITNNSLLVIGKRNRVLAIHPLDKIKRIGMCY